MADLVELHDLRLSGAGHVNPVSGRAVDTAAAAAEAGAVVADAEAGLVEDGAGVVDGHRSGGCRCVNHTPQAVHHAASGQPVNNLSHKSIRSQPLPLNQCWAVDVDQHHIDETRLVTRRSARDQILLAWSYCCAYCGDPLGRSPTLDHVLPKVHGGLTVRNNLVACCWSCNSRKGHRPWVDWYRAQDFYSEVGEWAIARWINQSPEPADG